MTPCAHYLHVEALGGDANVWWCNQCGAIENSAGWKLPARVALDERELATMAETLRIVQARCTELLEKVRALQPQPPTCGCVMVDGERYAHGGCMAFHIVRAVGHINGAGMLIRGSWAGEHR